MTGKNQVPCIKRHKELVLAWASHDAAAYMLSLFSRGSLNKLGFRKLRAKSAFLTDSLGRPLDGQAGSELSPIMNGMSAIFGYGWSLEHGFRLSVAIGATDWVLTRHISGASCPRPRSHIRSLTAKTKCSISQ